MRGVRAIGGLVALACAFAAAHVPAATASSADMAWGNNKLGQLGNGTDAFGTLPRPIGGVSDALSIVGSERDGYALRGDGSVMAWGADEFGQLGNGATSTEPNRVPAPVSGLGGVTAVAANGKYALALLSNGTVVAWGRNNHGQLGDGSIANSAVPVAVSGLSGVTAIAAGEEYALALLSDGEVMAWGANYDGQLGDGTTTQRTVPVAVSGLSGIRAIAAGFALSMALSSEGAVSTWGGNGNGELGTGSTEPVLSTVPVPVPALSSGVTAISAGTYFGLALEQDGVVMAWGSNEFGQLGNGSSGKGVHSANPAPVSGMTEATSISGGGYAGYALLGNGNVESWGWNEYGQLATGEFVSSSVPVRVCGLQEVGGISASYLSAYAFGVEDTQPCPSVTSLDVYNGPVAGGTPVTITGTEFQGVTSVTFSNAAAEYAVNSATSIAAVSPPLAAYPAGAAYAQVPVTVTTGAGPSPHSGCCFTAYFRYYAPPTITKASPTKGPVTGGTRVTLSGTYLSAPTAVKFGSTAAASFTTEGVAPGKMTAVAPPEPAGTVDIVVTTPGGSTPISSADRFKFLPVVSAITPNAGTKSGGTSVTVSGSGFAPGKVATTLKFGSAKATAVNCVSTTECTAVSPAHAVGAVDVTATVNKLTSAKNAPADRFTYE